MAKKATARAVTTLEVIDVAPENPEVALIASEGSMLAGLLGNIRVFFSRAQDLEKRSQGALLAARLLKPPTNATEDLAVQQVVRQVNADKKEVEEHWTLTSKVHQFHRKLTAARDRAIKPLDEAADIGNRLHVAYVAAEQRRVREEEERQQREADERARRERDAELARLEQAALDKEMASALLSEREALFVDAVVKGTLVNRAAHLAGYKNPDQTAQRLMATPKIADAIQAKRDAITIREQAAAKAAAPLITDDVPEVRPDVITTGERTTTSAFVHDVEAFIAAALDPTVRTQLGIPADIAIDAMRRMLKDGTAPILNEYARKMGDKINRWPGIRVKRTTGVI